MKTRITIVALALVACDPKSVGSTVSAGAAETSSAVDPGDDTDSGDPTEADPVPLGLGAPCDHQHPTRVDAKLMTVSHPECEGAVCLYADVRTVESIPCDTDADCGELGECVQDGDGGHCALSQAHVADRSMCSQVCDSDADCQTDEDTTCVSGFGCARMAALGELCCQRVCVCLDDLAFTDELDTTCENGTAPGCCVDGEGQPVEPPPAGCGVG